MIHDVPPADSSDIEAVFFDWGGVLTDLPSIVVPQVMKEFGIERIPESHRSKDAVERFHRLERGELSLEEYLEAARATGYETHRLWDPADEAFVYPRLKLRPAVVTWVSHLRAAGYRTALVSNNVAEYWPGVIAGFDADDMFDVVINSAHVGMRKPEAGIYELAIEAMGVDARRGLFLDDHPDNVDGAAAVGMHAIQVTADDQHLFSSTHALLDQR